MKVKIYKSIVTPMQSAPNRDPIWFLEYLDISNKFTENLMGWTGSYNMNQEILLKFTDKISAIKYAEKNNLSYEIEDDPHNNGVKPKSYANNFKAE